MSIEFKSGDLLNSRCEIICHQVNCKGVMGGGIALQIREKYPDVYYGYRNHCARSTHELLGTALMLPTVDGAIIANLFGQDDFGRDRCHTNYSALRMAFNQVVGYCRDFGHRRIGIPFGIGCGLAGGEWSKVIKIIEETFEDTYLEVQIWKLEK